MSRRPTCIKIKAVACSLGIGLLLSACGGAADQTDAGSLDVVDPPPLEPATATFTLTPSDPAPGETFTATFARDHSRGGYFILSLWDGEAWNDPAFLLESDANQGSPTAVAAADGFDIDDYGVSGPGPDGLVLPDEMAEGYWRLCTESARSQVCTQIVVGLDA